MPSPTRQQKQRKTSSDDDFNDTTKKLKIPDFHPLPPTTLLNRIINALLAPLFYLLFTVVVSIVVVPVYTAIRHVSGAGRGERVNYGGRGGRVRVSGGNRDDGGGGSGSGVVGDEGPGEAARLSRWVKGYPDSAAVRGGEGRRR